MQLLPQATLSQIFCDNGKYAQCAHCTEQKKFARPEIFLLVLLIYLHLFLKTSRSTTRIVFVPKLEDLLFHFNDTKYSTVFVEHEKIPVSVRAFSYHPKSDFVHSLSMNNVIFCRFFANYPCEETEKIYLFEDRKKVKNSLFKKQFLAVSSICYAFI